MHRITIKFFIRITRFFTISFHNSPTLQFTRRKEPIEHTAEKINSSSDVENDPPFRLTLKGQNVMTNVTDLARKTTYWGMNNIARDKRRYDSWYSTERIGNSHQDRCIIGRYVQMIHSESGKRKCSDSDANR